MTKLYDRAMNVKRELKGWHDEHTDFLEAYIAFFYDPVIKSISYNLLKNEYRRFEKYYTVNAYTSKANRIINGETRIFNRWQSLCLDGT